MLPKNTNIFFTGEIQVGKSTIIRRYLSLTGLSADGFMTYWEPGGDGTRNLYLSRFDCDARPAERYLLARDEGLGRVKTDNINAAFDRHGADILRASGKRDVIIMDELGKLESDAQDFQRAVMQLLDSDTPVLGVIKPIRTEFLNKIRNDRLSIVREVTVQNRDAELQRLLSIPNSRKPDSGDPSRRG
ncbi:MAG: nucleoside-triphosphatase [Oscillospiraceae bacterium]|nr:nucleoside-triphosphatase [Oscillospiraceae bacterium]